MNNEHNIQHTVCTGLDFQVEIETCVLLTSLRALKHSKTYEKGTELLLGALDIYFFVSLIFLM